jgi:hypothetical protein
MVCCRGGHCFVHQSDPPRRCARLGYAAAVLERLLRLEKNRPMVRTEALACVALKLATGPAAVVHWLMAQFATRFLVRYIWMSA